MEPSSNGAHEEVEAARAAEEALRRLRHIEFTLVAVTCLAAVAAMLFAGWGTWRTRQSGHIIADCTTPGGRCYEQNRAQATEYRESVLKALSDLKAGILEGVACERLQILEHRNANETAHQEEARHHGYTYMAPPTQAPPSIPQDLIDACKHLLPPTLGGK